ncbi:MAG TPA: DUF4041 domain-containing protein [Lachnospiraceae bacterium]|jgi:hypothetical protein|nr:DUF4041 domain-containing protein [Lachnospiraceae bacterium]HCA69332.1 DUF4041 domain-containing protein [Lachnospiraceae bacterium]HCM12761.1 DUF4041 domain-containing protein [Lachnospiraceae bacterium]HCR39391.1 DUF4041 domain-containing protein [Lachnospiraceae bacterium]
MYPKKKWYLKTWFICLLFAFWFFVFPGLIGLILLILQVNENKKLLKKYGEIDKLDDLTQVKRNDLQQATLMLENEKKEMIDRNAKLAESLELKNKELRLSAEKLTTEILELEKQVLIHHYSFSDYDGLTSEECKNRLSLLKVKTTELIKSDKAINIISDNNVAKKIINNNRKQILRLFNCECDNILLNLSVKNIDTSRNKVQKSFETINSIFSTDGMSISKELLELKLEELNLVYTSELKKEQELAEQKAIKEQMIEEERVRREIEREKSKLEKDQAQCNNEISKLLQYLQKTENDIEKQLYIDKIKELEDKLKQLETDKATVLEREANAKAGYVYVISNIGSFGEDIFKIGMTRRLEPMDRIKELSSASVPFEFDVHAMIFSTDAPSLETALHQHFEKRSVNKVNLRKEFFKVSINEIESFVKENYNNTVEFTKTAIAKEYRQSLQIA